VGVSSSSSRGGSGRRWLSLFLVRRIPVCCTRSSPSRTANRLGFARRLLVASSLAFDEERSRRKGRVDLLRSFLVRRQGKVAREWRMKHCNVKGSDCNVEVGTVGEGGKREKKHELASCPHFRLRGFIGAATDENKREKSTALS
jgi:hypothetical protein